MGRIIVIILALVVIAGGVWYYLGMPGYEQAEVPAATAPATTPASDSTAPASPSTP